ncbi:MAG: MAE_28990/MAE_18760 family HEPN-like nuclease [Verrucomicrobiia bacterium]|jgi:hypothetical protein
MNVRTLSLLADFLDEEFAWRRKELTAVQTDVRSGIGENKRARIRSGVALLYAHWEGFVKQSAEAYLAYIATRDLRLDELQPGLLSLCLRTKLRDFTSTHDVSVHIAFLEFVTTQLGDKAKMPTTGAVHTGGNLNSELLKRIVLTLGLDYAPYELKENLLDSQLLNWRNKIAHGKGYYPDETEFESLYAEVTVLLRTFKDQVSNAAALKTYRK